MKEESQGIVPMLPGCSREVMPCSVLLALPLHDVRGEIVGAPGVDVRCRLRQVCGGSAFGQPPIS